MELELLSFLRAVQLLPLPSLTAATSSFSYPFSSLSLSQSQSQSRPSFSFVFEDTRTNSGHPEVQGEESVPFRGTSFDLSLINVTIPR